MKAVLMCATLAIALAGCFALAKAPKQMANHRVSVQIDGDRLTARKHLGSVGESMAKSAGVRVRSPSIQELGTWETYVEMTSYAPDRVCFRTVDHQGAYDQYGDGEVRSNHPADYTGAKVALDTASGAHYDAVPIVEVEERSFQFDSYATDDGLPPRWVPAVSHWRKYTVDACFDTAAPLAGETSVRWSLKNQNWELSYDFAFGAPQTAQASRPAPSVAPAPPAPPRPESFAGRWRGVVVGTMVADKDTTTSTAELTISIDEHPKDIVELRFEDGAFACAFRAKVSGRRARILGGQTCKIKAAATAFTFKTSGGDLALSETGLTLSVVFASTRRVAGKTERGTITLTGELAAL